MCSTEQPEAVTIHPVNATAVKITWSGSTHLSTSLQYTSFFTDTGAVMSQYETTVPLGVALIEVILNDDIMGYEHNFTLHYVMDHGEANVTYESFVFGKFTINFHMFLGFTYFCFTDKKLFQIQFGPIDFCLNWGVSQFFMDATI